MYKNKKGFSLIEIIVVIAIIGMLAGIIVVSLGATRKKSRDTKRKYDLSQIGRFFSVGCYLPNTGGGEYDLNDIINEMVIKYPQYQKYLSTTNFKDPLIGTELESYYKYEVSNDGKNCVLYANFESDSEEVTLPGISAPTMGGRIGVFEAPLEGWNGSRRYYQISK